MNYSNLRKFDVANGEGVRISLFVSGCQFHCPGCFNSEAWDYCSGMPYTEETSREIVEFVKNPYIAGLSILGGDPLWQTKEGIESLIALCKKVHSVGKTVWMWSGFTWEQIFSDSEYSLEYRRELIRNCDVWVDGLFDQALKDITLKWMGSSNQRAIDVQKSLKKRAPVLYKN